MTIKRCNLSGIYIFDILEGEEKLEPTCLEDCTSDTLRKWLEKQDKECLIRTVEHLCRILKGVSEYYGIMA